MLRDAVKAVERVLPQIAPEATPEQQGQAKAVWAGAQKAIVNQLNAWVTEASAKLMAPELPAVQACQKFIVEKAEVNLAIDNASFAFPAPVAQPTK